MKVLRSAVTLLPIARIKTNPVSRPLNLTRSEFMPLPLSIKASSSRSLEDFKKKKHSSLKSRTGLTDQCHLLIVTGEIAPITRHLQLAFRSLLAWFRSQLTRLVPLWCVEMTKMSLGPRSPSSISFSIRRSDLMRLRRKPVRPTCSAPISTNRSRWKPISLIKSNVKKISSSNACKTWSIR